MGASPPWIDITITEPADGQLVWTRRLLVEYPIKCTWDATAKTFTVPNGLIMPWYMIARWRIL